jgi:hypothetical protein
LPDVSAVAKFNTSQLKHVETHDKQVLPTADVIKHEAVDSRAEVKSFDASKLKHVETEEKNPFCPLLLLFERGNETRVFARCFGSCII